MFKILIDSETNEAIKHAGAIYLKNMITLGMKNDSLNYQDSEILKQNIVEGITRTPTNIRYFLFLRLTFTELNYVLFFQNLLKEIFHKIGKIYFQRLWITSNPTT
jgi:hypothetical protein